MTALLTADWSPFGKNGYFRKVEIYEMGWVNEVNFDNAIIIPARFGGPIAVIRDRTRPTRVAVKGIGKPIIGIYSSSGHHLSSFVWNSGQLIRLGWSSTEELLCIQENGEVLIYSMFGKYIHAFRMGQEIEDTKVIDAQVFHNSSGTGICVLTGAYRLFVTNSLKKPVVRQLAEIPRNLDLPNSWAVVHEDRQTFVLFSKGMEMYYISEAQVIQKNINNNEDRGCIVTDIAVSPCYQHVALYNSQKQLWIGSSNLRKNYRLSIMHNSGRPSQLTWCGSEAVVACWDESVVIIGRNEDVLHYSYELPIVLVSEIDCVRVLSSFNTDIIQPVPNVILELYRLNSTSPGSYLLEASKQFQKKNHRANEYLHLVQSQITTAIEQCIEASSHEFNPDNQKILITAAQFGKTFAENFSPDEYVRMCRTLRVLNAVRDPKIGIYITYPQYEHLTLKNLLDRLILRRHYYIAIQAANYMRLNNEDGSTRILEHWAYYKVSQLDADREQVAKEIATKLGNRSGVSYIDIAKKAVKYGRIKLAIKLIDFEQRPTLQVSMLLELEKYTEALQKAVDSGNTDLISIVIVTMQRKMPSKDFQLEVRNDSSVYSLYKKYCRERNKEALLRIYRQEDDDNEKAAYHLREAYSPENFSMKTTFIESAKESYKKDRNEVNMALCEEQKKLLTKQKELETKFKKVFVELSLQDTIYELLLLKQIKIAEELKTVFHVSDRKYWWLRIEALAELNDWSELNQFSKIKSPIGYEPFIDVCLKYKKESEARQYANRIKDENKIGYLVTLKLYREAVKVAELQRDIPALDYIRANCNNSIGSEIDAALAKLVSSS